MTGLFLDFLISGGSSSFFSVSFGAPLIACRQLRTEKLSQLELGGRSRIYGVLTISYRVNWAVLTIVTLPSLSLFLHLRFCSALPTSCFYRRFYWRMSISERFACDSHAFLMRFACDSRVIFACNFVIFTSILPVFLLRIFKLQVKLLLVNRFNSARRTPCRDT